MDQATQQNAAMVEETTAASHSLASEAESLRGLLMQFDIGASGTSLHRTAPRQAQTSHSQAGHAQTGAAQLRVAHSNLKQAAGW